jgi:hypothetical protein
VSEAKERDGRRQTLADLITIWWEKHQDWPVTVRELHHDVTQAIDPQGRGRQYIAAYVERLAGTRMAGFVFTRQPPTGKAATYALKKADAAAEDHRVTDAPYAPYANPGSNGNRHSIDLAASSPELWEAEI